MGRERSKIIRHVGELGDILFAPNPARVRSIHGRLRPPHIYAIRSLTYNDVTIASNENYYWREMILPLKVQFASDVESIRMVKMGGPIIALKW